MPIRMWLVLLGASAAFAQSEFSIYELLPPDTHRFAIVYDVSTSEPGAKFYLNPIRRGSKVSSERVLDLATGKELKWENITGKAGKGSGILPATTPDDSLFLKVELAGPVPEIGQARIRILKTYEDAASYYAQGDRLIFDRPLGIRRNVIVLPAGYELVACTVPVTVSTQTDGRIRIGMVNDRDDQLPMKITARRLP